jgi:hypothetical protein
MNVAADVRRRIHKKGFSLLTLLRKARAHGALLTSHPQVAGIHGSSAAERTNAARVANRTLKTPIYIRFPSVPFRLLEHQQNMNPGSGINNKEDLLARSH